MTAPVMRQPRLSTLVLMSVIGIVALNMTLPSLAHMADDFGITYAEASLSISLFMIVTAVLQLFGGPVADIFGRRPVLLVSLGIFALASVGCALAQSYGTFLVFRFIQGTVILSNLLSRAIVRDTSPPKEATSRLALIGMVVALGPMIAPMIGGLLDSAFGWRASYHAFWMLGVALIWLCHRDVDETVRRQGRSFSAHARAYGRLLRSAPFWAYALTIGFTVGVFFAFVTGAPLIASETFDLGPALIGVALGAPPLGFVLGNAISIRLSPRMSTGGLVLLGRLIAVLGMATALLVWRIAGPGPIAFFGTMPLIGIANGLSLPAANVGVMSVDPDLAGSAAGLSGALMVGAGAAMSALTGALLTQNADPARLLWLLVIMSALSFLSAVPIRRDGSDNDPLPRPS